jgi:ATP-dependent Clp protease protease subunit
MVRYNINERIRIRKIEDLVDLPQVIVVNDFNPAAALKFRDDFNKAVNTRQPVIPIIIDSYGGQVYSLFSMMDTIKSAPTDVKVCTISNGKSISCGSILLSCGHEGYRYINKYSTVMIHDVASCAWGKVEDIKVDLKEADRLNQVIFEILAKNCGKPKNYFKNLVKKRNHLDWFLNAEETVSHNIANYIGEPTFNLSIDFNLTFG